MIKAKWLTLNFISLLSILLISIGAWQNQKTTTLTGDSDYTTFLVTLYQSKNIYENIGYTSISSEQLNSKKPQRIEIMRANNFNTPLMSLFLIKLINFSKNIPTNIGVWIATSIICAAIGVWILLSTFTDIHSIKLFLPLLLLFLLNGYSLDNLTAGQISYFIFPVVCLAYKFCCDNKTTDLAITLGVISALKLFFLIFVFYFFMKKAWRELGIMITSTFIFFFLPVLFFHIKTYTDFFSLTHHYIEFISRSALSRNGSILGFISLLTYFLKSKITLFQLRLIAYTVVTYFIIRGIYFDKYTLQKLPAYSDELRFSFYIILALLCSPLAWTYYFVFLIIPFCVFIKINKRFELSQIFYLCLLLALTISVISGTAIKIEDTALLLPIRQMSTFTSLLFWLISFLTVVSNMEKQSITQDKKTQNKFLTVYIIASVIVISYNGLAKTNPYFISSKNSRLITPTTPHKEIIAITGSLSKNPYNPPHVKTFTY